MNTSPLTVPGITREEAARLYYALHRGQLAAWRRSSDLARPLDPGAYPAHLAAFHTASDCQDAALDAADITTALGRRPGEEAVSFAMRVGAEPNSVIAATERRAPRCATCHRDAHRGGGLWHGHAYQLPA